jgi:PmbA protein
MKSRAGEELQEIIPRSRCEEMLGMASRAAAEAGVRDVEVSIHAEVSALTRFANNTIHQNVSERGVQVSVRTQEDGRTARANTNRLTAEAVAEAAAAAIESMRAQTPDPEMLPLCEPRQFERVERHFEMTAQCAPAERARVVAEAIRLVESEGFSAAGIYSTEESFEALLNTEGLYASHAGTDATFSITVMGADSSGWAKANAPDLADIHPLALARSAAEKARISAKPVEIPPGRYTVILEPAAVLDLVGQIFSGFSATQIRDQRSFLTGRVGEPLFGGNVTIWDDVYHPLQSGAPFDEEGVPRQRLTLVDRGRVRDVPYSRASAAREGREATGHGYALPNELGEGPGNIVIAGGKSSLEEMVASTEKGILVTRLWYIREVEPFQQMMTGMTRDGTFLVDSGRVTRGLRNFRFNQSVVELLGNVEALSPAVRASGEEAFDMVVPAMKVNGFHFTGVTRF